MTRDSRWIAAVDLGASSGRVIVGRLAGDRFEMREVHRFVNEPVHLPSGCGVHLCWNATALFAEVCRGVTQACREVGSLEAIGIDTWGVDYGLIDADGVLAAPVFNYRDHRTDGVSQQVFTHLDAQTMYEISGCQVQDFNTVFQLAGSRDDVAMRNAKAMLLLPDLLGYWLTGRMATEVTNASTTGLVDPATRTWSDELIARVGLDVPDSFFTKLSEPGEILGPVLPQVLPGVTTAQGEPTPIVHVGSHDTASAVAGVPAHGDDFAYVSCGTWSLVGLELDAPVRSAASLADNFTNELGVDGTVRYLKNVSGMWVLNQCLSEWNDEAKQAGDKPLRLPALLETVRSEPLAARIVDLNDSSLVDPGPMTPRLDALLSASKQTSATTKPAVARLVIDSLALAYRAAIEQACRNAGKQVSVIHIVGGGSRNELLCQATADATGLPVIAGPAEGTALGNLLVAARAVGQISGGLDELRAVGAASSELRRYEPDSDAETTEIWHKSAEFLASIIEKAT